MKAQVSETLHGYAASESRDSPLFILAYLCTVAEHVGRNSCVAAPGADFCSSARESTYLIPLMSTVFDKYSMPSPLAVPANFLSFPFGSVASYSNQWQNI